MDAVIRHPAGQVEAFGHRIQPAPVASGERLAHHFQHRHVDEALVVTQLQDAQQFFQHALGGFLFSLQVLQPRQGQVDRGDHFRGRGGRHHGQQVFAQLLGFGQTVLVVQHHHHAGGPQGPGGAVP